MVGKLLKMIKMSDKFKDKPKTRQDVREAARKPKSAPSGKLANFKKSMKKAPTELKAAHAYKKRTPNPLSAGGGNTYIVNGKMVTKEAFLKAKSKPRPKRIKGGLKNLTKRNK